MLKLAKEIGGMPCTCQMAVSCLVNRSYEDSFKSDLVHKTLKYRFLFIKISPHYLGYLNANTGRTAVYWVSFAYGLPGSSLNFDNWKC